MVDKPIWEKDRVKPSAETQKENPMTNWEY